MSSERSTGGFDARDRRRRASVVRIALVTSLIAGAIAFAAAPAGAVTAWSAVPSPSPFRPANLALSAVSCASPTSCVAVGRRFDLNEDQPGIVIERWDGNVWSPVVQTASNATLSGVSCAGPKSCVAVGGNGKGSPLAQRWTFGGKWTTVSTPNVGSASLNGVDCATPTNCFAVGSSRSGSKIATLIEHWNGKSWKRVPSPNLAKSTRSVLNAVSCASTTRCVAVGNHEESGDQVGGVLIEHWNGKTWKIEAAPNPKFTKTVGLLTTPLLTGVSCPSAKVCLAAGYAPNHSLIEKWNGTKWAIVPSPNLPAGNVGELRAVSCSSATDCAAVGTGVAPVDEREGIALRNSLAEHWNGKVWKIVPKAQGVPANTNGFEVGQLAELNGVSCPAKTSCAAVGNSSMAERWNGSKWSLAPLAGSASYSNLAAVSCPGPATCLAIGGADPLLDAGRRVLAERWDGATWSIVPSSTPAGKNVYASVESISCVSTTDCTAVGHVTGAGGSDGQAGNAFIERWNGSAWTLVPPPSPAPKLVDADLHAVSCVSTTDCSAVGEYSAYVGRNVTNRLLAEHWNGSAWSVVPIPGAGTGGVNGVSCSSATNCFAVGQTTGGKPLVDRWNGTQWTAVASPAPTGNAVYGLFDVTCIADTDCTIVGMRASATVVGTAPLIEHWDGTAWTLVPAPAPAGRDQSALNAVSCASATSCAAVGTLDMFRDAGHAAPLVEEWNGATWTIVAAATVPGAATADLTGVAPFGTGYVAVGASTSKRRADSQTLVEQRS